MGTRRSGARVLRLVGVAGLPAAVLLIALAGGATAEDASPVASRRAVSVRGADALRGTRPDRVRSASDPGASGPDSHRASARGRDEPVRGLSRGRQRAADLHRDLVEGERPRQERRHLRRLPWRRPDLRSDGDRHGSIEGVHREAVPGADRGTLRELSRRPGAHALVQPAHRSVREVLDQRPRAAPARGRGHAGRHLHRLPRLARHQAGLGPDRQGVPAQHPDAVRQLPCRRLDDGAVRHPDRPVRGLLEERPRRGAPGELRHAGSQLCVLPRVPRREAAARHGGRGGLREVPHGDPGALPAEPPRGARDGGTEMLDLPRDPRRGTALRGAVLPPRDAGLRVHHVSRPSDTPAADRARSIRQRGRSALRHVPPSGVRHLCPDHGDRQLAGRRRERLRRTRTRGSTRRPGWA